MKQRSKKQKQINEEQQLICKEIRSLFAKLDFQHGNNILKQLVLSSSDKDNLFMFLFYEIKQQEYDKGRNDVETDGNYGE